MKTIITLLRPQFYFPNHTYLTANPPFCIPISTTSLLKHPKNPPPRQTIGYPPTRNTNIDKPFIPRKSQNLIQVIPTEYSRIVILGTVSLGFVLFLMSFDDQKALALGPEGPLMEEFWDNMRRYALYALTVSTGVAYTLFQPIYELLKNPISAILILTVFGGSIYIVSQVLSAMVGVSEFNYDYSY